MKQTPGSLGFWGKIQTGPDGAPEQWLSLKQHCLDVAAVFYALTKLPGIRSRLQAGADRPLDEAGLQRLAVIALLHDVGKANLGFQDKAFDRTIRAGHVRELAPFFAEAELQAKLTGALEAETLCAWFAPPHGALAFLVAAWSHHGKPEVFHDSRAADHRIKAGYWLPQAGRDPFRAIAELLAAARDAYPAAFAPGGAPLPGLPALQHRFAGLVMLADWLGSHRGFFPLQGLDEPAPRRTPEDAARALRRVGLDARDWQAHLANHSSGFDQRFGFPPRALQAELDGLATGEPRNRLLIAEAETGAGKTEAALARFFRLFAAGAVDALYFALPTRVAARELYRRVERYVGTLFPAEDRPPVLLAVPGYARVDNVPVERLLPGDETRYPDDTEQARRERLWAAEHPKRFLAATIAVGTLDQALLSALQTPHAHLRSACLDRSLLVVDEVHASDPYMRRLLHGLLDHHLSLGGHALLLSATLGSQARAAFTGQEPPSLEAAVNAPYPALTDGSGVPRGLPADSAPPKPVRLEPRPCLDRPETLLPELAAAFKAGARVLAVLNTVGRAIALQRAAEACPDIEPFLFRCGGVIAPHHGRFAPVDRERLDEAVTDALGKDSPDGPRLLIGTQTLEQSLDIDADLLVTDLCPMDVLLQRIGRLHRHREPPHRRSRPEGFERARCLVVVPETADLENFLDAKGNALGPAKRHGLGSVYPDLRVLQLTRDLVVECPEIELPRDNRRLVEGATHPERLAMLGRSPCRSGLSPDDGTPAGLSSAGRSCLSPADGAPGRPGSSPVHDGAHGDLADDSALSGESGSGPTYSEARQGESGLSPTYRPSDGGIGDAGRWARHGREVEGGDLAKGVRAFYAGLAEIYRLSFGETGCGFRDNEEARTRLGLDSLRVPLDRRVTSPFGIPLGEVLIPGHLADRKTTDQQAVVFGEEPDGIVLSHGAHRYRYSRYGLEKLDE